VRRAIEAPPAFDPRRHASSRLYRFLAYLSPVRSPLWRARAWHITDRLDVDPMRRAASELTGEHDFAAFSRREPDVTTVRRVERCDVVQHGLLLTFEMEADAFLRQQIRRTVGSLVEVGRGKLSVEQFAQLLRAAVPASAGPLAPPHGLYLVAVRYPGLDLSPCDALSWELSGPSTRRGPSHEAERTEW
jgi:tRNA pseudouridine38-40 synthase